MITAWLTILVSMGTIGMSIWMVVASRRDVYHQRAHNLRIAADAMRTMGELEKAAEYEQRAAGTWRHNRGLNLS